MNINDLQPGQTIFTLLDEKADKKQLDDKQDKLTLTTTGSSGPATLVGATLNIPQYSGGGSASPLTTKGDIYVHNASADTRLPVGLDTQVLIADSTQATGLKWGSNTAATPTGYYGQWQDDYTQTAAASNVGYPMIFRTTDLSNGVTVVTDGTNLTHITFANTGIYNLQFSAQFQNTHNQLEDVSIWIRKNGVDVAGSTGYCSIPNSHGGINGHAIVSWNYLLDIVAGDYYQLVWSTTGHTYVTMEYYAAGNPPPSTASVIATVTQQSGIMAGTGITAINSLTGSAQTLSTGTSGTDFGITSSGSTHTFNIPTASSTNRGLLSTTDWNTFNSKQNAITQGNLTESTSSVLTITGGSNAVIGSGTSIQVKQASASQSGFLSSTDYTTFNNKQGALTLTTTGSSGASTLVGNTLNIPQYSGGTDSINWTHTEALPSIGSAIKAEPVYATLASLTSNAMNPVSQRLYLIATWVPRAMTITGVKWIQATVGSFVASNFNGVALYTQSGGTFTRQAVSANDATIFTTAGSSQIRNKAFTSTYSASAGVHYAALMYSASSGTAPALMITPSPVYNAWTLDNTNGMYLSMFAPTQTSFPSTLSISGNLLSVNIPYISLY
jgi:hypothetical protein